MADKINFYTGLLSKVWNTTNKTPNVDATTGVPIVKGRVYFALSADGNSGRILYDNENNKRIMLDAGYADNAGNASTANSATKATYDSTGTKDIRTYLASLSLNTAKTGIVAKDGAGNIVSTVTPSFLPLAGGTMTGNIKFNASDLGLLFKDSAGREYKVLNDNGSSLWIGASSSTGVAHTGKLYLSAGYDSATSKGNSTAYISVPSLSGSTWSSTQYAILHEGNYTSWVYSKGQGDKRYASSLSLNTAKTSLSLKAADGTVLSTVTPAFLPLAGGTMTGAITFTSQSSAFNDKNILFSGGGRIGADSSGIGIYANKIYLRPNSANSVDSAKGIVIEGSQVNPGGNETISLGTASLKWNNVYAKKFHGNLDGTATYATYATGDTNTIQKTYVSSVYVKANTNEVWTKNGAGDTTKVGTFVPVGSNGLIDIKYIPASALERVVTVANETARFALTTSNVQLGDVVKQTDTGKMYFVIDTSKLNQASGYMEFTAGSAASVPWSGITGKPNLLNTSSNISISGLVIKFNRYDAAGTAQAENKITIPTASASAAGVVSTGTQTFAGAKTFNGKITASGGIALDSNTTDSTLQYILGIDAFADGGTVHWQTASDVKVGKATAADKATADSSGANIRTTYMKYPLSMSATNVIKMTRGDGTTSTIQPHDIYPTAWTWTAGSTAGPTAKISMVDNGTATTAISVAAIPAASETASGIITTGNQTLKGTKTFVNRVSITDSGDAAYSKTGTASIYTNGGIAVAKQLSAKTVRIDNNKSDKGCTLTFNDTYNCLEFVFA